MKKLLLFLTIFTMMSPASFARSKKSNKNYRSRVSSKKSVRKYNFVYERVWYYSLTPKQQSRYLKTMDELAYKIATGRKFTSFDVREFLNLLMPPAFAALPFNNGYNYTGNRSFSEFIQTVDMGSYEPSCSTGESPCAAYTGLVEDSAGNFKLACSPNSTPTCVRRGSQAVLKRAQRGCDVSSPPARCVTLDRLMEKGTKGVRDMCASRRSAQFCDDAMTALAGDDIPPSPISSTSPSGVNCDVAASELISKHQNSRTGSAAENAAYNNDFWTQMTGFAQKACGRSSISSTMRTVGVCNIANMDASGGNTAAGRPANRMMETSQVVTYTEEQSVGFARCKAFKRRKTEAEKQRMIDALDSTGIGRSALTTRRNEISETMETRMTNEQELIDRRGSCTFTEVSSISAQQLEISEITSLAEKIKKGNSLTQDEENKFKAATGLASRQFKRVFCGSGSMNEFKQRLSQETRATAQVQGQGQSSNFYRGLAQTARTKMSRCAGALESLEETGCGFYNVEDRNLLREASDSNPILIKNRSNNSCSLVTKAGFEERGTTTVNGNTNPRREHWVTFKTPRSEVPRQMSQNELFAENIVSVYRCDGEGVRRTNYRRDDDRAGEQEARDFIESQSEI